MALYYSKSLHLDSTQYSYIMAKAIDMARRIYRDHRINVWNEEMEILKKTLNKKQLRSFFVKKNSGIVTLEFNNAWKKLKEAGLTEQLDSAKDANDAINYIFKRQMIKDLYRSYGTPQKKYLADGIIAQGDWRMSLGTVPFVVTGKDTRYKFVANNSMKTIPTFANAISIGQGAKLTIDGTDRAGLKGSVSGSGSLVLNTGGVR